jgi:phosphonate transport system substrate-binding protein
MGPTLAPNGVRSGIRTRHRAALALAAAGLALLLAGCDHEGPRRRVRLVDGPAKEPAASAARSASVTLAVAASCSSPATLVHYQELTRLLGESLGVNAELVRQPTYADVIELLRRRQCTAGLLCDYAFLRARKEFGAELLVNPVVHGDVRYRAYIIAAKDGPPLDQLAGRRFATTDPLCTAGWLYPAYRLFAPRRMPEFRGHVIPSRIDDAVRAVANGDADAAGIEGPIYDRLVAAGDPAALRTRIVDRSPPLGTPPIVVHPQLDADLRQQVRHFLLTLHESARGREILRGIDVDRFVDADATLYAPAQDMADAVERP